MKQKINDLSSRQTYSLFLAVLSVSQLIQIFSIRRWSSWFDEGFTVFAVHYDWGQMYERLQYDVHPPLYYILAKAWATIFGDDIYAIRMLSVVLNLGLGLSVFYLCRACLRNNYQILAASSLAALGPFTLRYGIEARMYVMAGLLGCLATLALVHATRSRGHKMHLLYAVNAVLIAAAFLTQYLAILIPVAHGLWLVHNTAKGYSLARIWHWVITSPWVRYMFLALILVSFWLPAAIEQNQSIQGSFWIRSLSITSFISPIFSLFLLEDVYSQVGGLVAVVVSAAVIWLTYSAYKGLNQSSGITKDKGLGSVTFIALAPFVGLGLISTFFQSVYYDRYFSTFAWAIYIALGVGLARRAADLGKQGITAGVIALIVVSSYSGYRFLSFGEFDQDKHTHHAAMVSNRIQEQGDPNQIVLSSSLWHFYDVFAHYPDGNHYVLDRDKWGKWGGAALVNDSKYLLDTASDVPSRGGQTIWLIGIDAQAAEVPNSWRLVSSSDEQGIELHKFIDER